VLNTDVFPLASAQTTQAQSSDNAARVTCWLYSKSFTKSGTQYDPIHSEIPQQEEGVMEGFQLWLNLHSSEKMKTPWHRDYQNGNLPKLLTDRGVDVTVIAGESHGIKGAVEREITLPLYLDLHLPMGAQFEQTLPADHNAFIYLYRGEVTIAGQTVPSQRMAILTNSSSADGVVIASSSDSKLILIAGKPLKQPIVQYGPFVMNTQQEIYQALNDFRDGHLSEFA
jgi:redox-sensitive bicupin YhaK (pirin superfamily)